MPRDCRCLVNLDIKHGGYVADMTCKLQKGHDGKLRSLQGKSAVVTVVVKLAVEVVADKKLNHWTGRDVLG